MSSRPDVSCSKRPAFDLIVGPIIGACYPFTGWIDQEIHVWRAQAAQIADRRDLEAGEFIEGVRLYPHGFFERVKRCYCLDGILALSLWLDQQVRLA